MKKVLALLTVVSLAALCKSAYSANYDLWDELVEHSTRTKNACRFVIEKPESRDGCLKQNHLQLEVMQKARNELSQLVDSAPPGKSRCFWLRISKRFPLLTAGINRAVMYEDWVQSLSNGNMLQRKFTAQAVVDYTNEYAHLADEYVELVKHCD